MYWQVRVSSLLLSRLSKTFFRCEITFRNGQTVFVRISVQTYYPGCHQHCARLNLLHLTTCSLPPGLPLPTMGRDSSCSRASVCFTPSPPSTCQPALLPITFIPSCRLAARGAEQTDPCYPRCFPPSGVIYRIKSNQLTTLRIV